MTNFATSPQLKARAATDSDRVQINRVMASNSHDLDPFLLIDYSRLAVTKDAATLPHHPAHPHGGLEIIQYVLEGELEHRDNLGNRTRVCSGDVQWLSTASGMIHEEVPAAVEHVVSVSIWINMAVAQKNDAAKYQHIAAAELPKHCHDGIFYKALCGQWQVADRQLDSPLNAVAANTGLLHIEMSPGSALDLSLTANEQYFLYLFHGELIGENVALTAQRGVMLRLNSDEPLKVEACAQGASLLLMKGNRLAEPLVQYGPVAVKNPQQVAQTLDNLQHPNSKPPRLH